MSVMHPVIDWHNEATARVLEKSGAARLSSTYEVGPLLDEVAVAMSEMGYSTKDAFGVRLALEEALVNAIKHGHGYDPTKIAEFRYSVSPEQVLLEIEDQGNGFDPENVPDPTAPENLERSCGRGLHLMRCYVSWIRYNGRGNHVTLCKFPSVPLKDSNR